MSIMTRALAPMDLPAASTRLDGGVYEMSVFICTFSSARRRGESSQREYPGARESSQGNSRERASPVRGSIWERGSPVRGSICERGSPVRGSIWERGSPIRGTIWERGSPVRGYLGAREPSQRDGSRVRRDRLSSQAGQAVGRRWIAGSGSLTGATRGLQAPGAGTGSPLGWPWCGIGPRDQMDRAAVTASRDYANGISAATGNVAEVRWHVVPVISKMHCDGYFKLQLNATYARTV